ncbi:Choline transporter-like protein [Kalmanozyma brasiliensis GHG001]|uniref:Protein PNS1 n=1 Tax=Kalmanozyma brasiliensis (strain GHG001) TaxID=1365824 RepID=V5EGH9_KALBG|nr:Choline transporter-like protein [Kalmanozyma brasiliensis GHG001]EST09646.1 Choline transporter-like protein [Kalmanozyma brasiliensis GHG001]
MSQQYSYGGGGEGGYQPPQAPPQQPPHMQQPNSYAPGPYQGQPHGAQNQYYNGQQPQHPPPQQYYGNDQKMALKPEGFEGERFKPKPKFNDPIFLVLFLLVFGGFIALSVICLMGYSNANVNVSIGRTNVPGSTLNGQTVIMFMICCGVALVLSFIYILLVRTFPKFILEATLLLTTLANVAFCVYLWVSGNTAAAIIFTIFAVFSVIAYFFMRKRIPLAKLILVTVIRTAEQYKSVYVVALTGLIVETAFSAWTSWVIVATYQRFQPSGQAAGSSSSNASIIGLMVFIVFAYYWISEVIKNVAFTTVAGIFGVAYYNVNKVSHAAWGAFRRSMTYSLGSICFGSLIVAILDMLRALFNLLQSQAASDGDMTGQILACIASCCIGCIRALVDYFNRYAYINIALYGNGYIRAAKETWSLLKDRGIDALINDSLVNIVFNCGAFIVGLLTALFAYVYEQKTNPQYLQNSSGYYSIILLVAFGLGFNIALSVGAGSIASGVSTYFVALAEDPYVLQGKNPELFEMIRQQYPHVVQAVNH